MLLVPDEASRQPGSVAALRAQFRDGKAALLAHFRESRPTATSVAPAGIWVSCHRAAKVASTCRA